jgi:hypothetical protein
MVVMVNPGAAGAHEGFTSFCPAGPPGDGYQCTERLSGTLALPASANR